ncbi:hypothetical protein B0H10DRAFT_2043399 [Mycena sp. CBHHK59/15]|nr:hypothetical protein B0H10DRAFT_2043399 [Mycena sp. CBHHK59/15]
MNFIQLSIAKLRDSPKQAIDSARRGSIPDLKNLATFWQEVPELLPLGILDVFFSHLDADKVFTVPSVANERSPLAERAFYALTGLCKSGNFLLPGTPHHHDPAVLKAWPGIFKWSVFLFTMRVTSTLQRPVEGRRSAMDIIATAWFSLTRAAGLREAIAATRGTIEITTQLWLLDASVPSAGPPFIDVPCTPAALDALLVDRATVDRALAAAGGKPETLVQPALAGLRSALSSAATNPTHPNVYLDLICHLSQGVDHPVRHAFLHAGAIAQCTRAARVLAGHISVGGPAAPAHLNSMVAAFGFLANCLESTDGFSWVAQSLAADLLLAFADCSPYLGRLDAEDRGIVYTILQEIVPRYLVYRSVVQAVDAGMQRLKAPQIERLEKSVARKVWIDFQHLAEERLMVVLHAAAVKGKAGTCDNAKCQKIDAKNTFRKCGGCSTTLYCSKECQAIAWKEGGHKAMCKMKQRERLEGKSESISKSDVAFFRHLAARDAQHHLPHLRRLARTQHPALRPCELVIRIDYTAVPPAYAVFPLADFERQQPPMQGSANAEARNDALLERARAHPERTALIQSVVANGRACQMVLSVVTGSFWDDGEGEPGDSEEDVDEEDMDTKVDVVDMMMARTALNSFLKARGEEPAF